MLDFPKSHFLPWFIMGLRNLFDHLTCEFGPMKPQNGPKNSPIQTLNFYLFTFVKSILSTYLMGAHKDLVLDPY